MNIYFLVIASVICGLIGCGIRIYDFNNFFDGMFLDSGNLSIYSVLVCLLPAVICIFMMYKYTDQPTKLLTHRGYFHGIFSLICGCVVLYLGLSLTLNYMSYESIYYYHLQNPYSLTNNLSLHLPYYISIVVMGLYLCAVGVIHSIGKDNAFNKIKLLTLLPVIHSIISIIYVYIHYSSSLIITENAFVLFSVFFTAPAYLNLARFISGEDENKTAFKRGVLFSCISLSINLAYYLSELILILTNSTAFEQYPQSSQLLSLILSINLVVVFSTIKTEKYDLDKKNNKLSKRYR